MKSDFYIYAYFRPDDTEPFYIGKGQGRRAYCHLEALNLNLSDPFHVFLNKITSQGIRPRIEFLFDSLTEDEAFEYEKDQIAFYGRRCNQTGCLLNLTEGGDGVSGYIHSEETRSKMSRVKIGVLTLEDRVQISERMIGNSYAKGHIDPRRKPVARVRLGRIDKVYDSIQHAAKSTGGSISSIRQALSGRSKGAYGYKWIYLDKEEVV